MCCKFSFTDKPVLVQVKEDTPFYAFRMDKFLYILYARAPNAFLMA